MEITEVRVSLREGENKKLKAFATVTFDNCFVVRDIKVIEGNKGLFVAMPSKKQKDACPKCGYKNVIRSKFCNQCAAGLENFSKPPFADANERQTEHRDIAHPITLEFRETIQKKVIDAYQAKKSNLSQPFSSTDSQDKNPNGS
ncbi:MAG: SpoVG family protein [Candidatus Omnitrophota bacterium]|nr:SpoVG family protein [Candidatus Omnitrophota bacterium]